MAVINRKSLKATTITTKISKWKKVIPKKKYVEHYIVRKPKSTIDYFNKGFGGDLE